MKVRKDQQKSFEEKRTLKERKKERKKEWKIWKIKF